METLSGDLGFKIFNDPSDHNHSYDDMKTRLSTRLLHIQGEI